MTEVNNTANYNAYNIWQKLDAKDGNDGKITKSVWDEFRNVIGMGKTINNYITEENAVKSIKFYLKNITEEVKTKLESYLSISPSSVEQENELTPINTPNDNTEQPVDIEEEGVGGVDNPHSKREKTYHPSIVADGYIDPTAQGDSGDCWLLSGLSALSETQWGRDAIKDAIDIKENGDIIITLKGAYGNKKQFKITKAELDSAKNDKKYSQGDVDVLAIELAVEKYRKQFGETLDGGFHEEIYRLITGSHNTQTIYENKEIKSLLNKAKANPEKYVIGASFNIGDSAGSTGFHAYNVSRFETDENGKNWIILTNPWGSRREIRVTEEEFMKYIVRVEVLANPKGNTPISSINSDGKIGTTRASKKNTDFNVAPAIHAVANTYPNIIKNSIQKDSLGNLKITLKGVNKTYTISPKEIAKAKDSGRYTEGDDDVIALELAIEKYGKEKYQTGGLADDSSNLIQAGTELYGISDSTVIFLLTGEENKYANLDENNKYIISDTPPNQYAKIDPKKLFS